MRSPKSIAVWWASPSTSTAFWRRSAKRDDAMERHEIRAKVKWWITAAIAATFALIVIHYVLRIV